jgi:hypothetical protein
MSGEGSATIRSMPSRALRLIASSALVAGLLMLPAAAQGRASATLSLNVNFALSGAISVVLPSGQPVGVTSGAPTVIPAGFYTVVLSGPGGCTAMPHFNLNGPGEAIHDNLNEGESDNFTYNAYFLPNSTYTWSSDAVPGVVHTFVTSATIEGTAPASTGPQGLQSSQHTTVNSSDLAASNVLPFRGTLTGAVSAAGKLTIAFKGKSIASLKAGQYTISITDKSSTTGFMLQKIKRMVSLTGPAFVGKRTASVKLTAGTWIVTPQLGKKTYSIIVK